MDGRIRGNVDGCREGELLGCTEGRNIGRLIGCIVGNRLGIRDGCPEAVFLADVMAYMQGHTRAEQSASLKAFFGVV